jgi:hypothetical protein
MEEIKKPELLPVGKDNKGNDDIFALAYNQAICEYEIFYQNKIKNIKEIFEIK